ncbi:hypothetical protein F2Q70_00006249 [Brassica cretica]|uniref:Uncharacterized protein n=1 Tax=Brassica cretica TaxID=69181 RepID=A0A8S9J0L3_BRACR|nr:hypothetical protein F2Q70_00006249 [Brassica cretica]
MVRDEVRATKGNEATQTREPGAEREGPTVATSPREKPSQTLNTGCLQLPRDPPNTNQSKESQARTDSPPDMNHDRRYEVVTQSDDVVVRKEDLKISASKSAYRDRIHPFNRRFI